MFNKIAIPLTILIALILWIIIWDIGTTKVTNCTKVEYNHEVYSICDTTNE